MGKLYVAYGSNLNKERMKHRCRNAKFMGTGVIENYELQFKGSLYGAHATIAPQMGSSVPVAIWSLRGTDEKYLDYYEGYRDDGYCYYDKEQIRVHTANGDCLVGMVYIMDREKDFGLPSHSYYEIVRKGYADCGLDETVLEQALHASMELAQARMSDEPHQSW